jgi:hypothetical protein
MNKTMLFSVFALLATAKAATAANFPDCWSGPPDLVQGRYVILMDADEVTPDSLLAVLDGANGLNHGVDLAYRSDVATPPFSLRQMVFQTGVFAGRIELLGKQAVQTDIEAKLRPVATLPGVVRIDCVEVPAP